MKTSKVINVYFIAFGLELVALIYVSYIAWQSIGPLAGIHLLLLSFIWGRYFSPKASNRLAPRWLFWAKLLILSAPAYGFVEQADYLMAMAYFTLVLSHLLLSAFQETL